MALFDRNQRQRSSLCSTATIVLFVALCLLGLWMLVSSPAAIQQKDVSSEVKRAEVVKEKEEDSSLDATNTVKLDSPNVVVAGGEDEDPAKNSGDGKGGTAGASFDDENGRTEGGELVKPEGGGGGEAGKSDEEEAGAGGGQDQPATGAKESGESKDVGGELTVDESAAEEAAAASDVRDATGGGSPKNQTFDDENGKMDGVDLVKDDGNKTFSDEAIRPDGAVLTVKPLPEDTASTTTDSTDAAAAIISEENRPDGGEQGQGQQELPATAAEAEAEALPNGQAELLTERVAQDGSFTTQAAESTKEKKNRSTEKKKKNINAKHKKTTTTPEEEESPASSSSSSSPWRWKLCNTSAGADYIPCLDNEAAIRRLKTTTHYEHRERHCPAAAPTCLVPSPAAYREPIRWPHSRDSIWYHNVPHTRLAAYKGHQNWVKVSGEHLTFPGGGTQFKHGALHYIDLIQSSHPELAWGRRSRVVLDVGCGVASFGGYLFDRGALAMSLAPKDEHEAQVQFALERGIPAISAVMGTRRLPFPGGAFDVVHCARCRVPWHVDGGVLLLELNRLLRPGGFFVWSATPVYQNLPDDVEIWNEMVKLTMAMCWEMVVKTKEKDALDQIGLVIFRKPKNNVCYDKRREEEPPLCQPSDDPNAAWNITLRACMHRVPTDPSARGSRWPEPWPERLDRPPYWLGAGGQVGVYGKPAPDDFAADTAHWKTVVQSSYLAGIGIDWAAVRNVMDMRAVYGGFAAALREMKVWVMNVVTIDSADTLPVIYERGLFGIYHDWCESFSTYPRSYDLLHADHLFSKLKTRCKVLPVIAEVDRILRPNGKLIVRDDKETMDEVQRLVKSLQWEVKMTVSKHRQAVLYARKTAWRPTEVEAR